MHESVKVETAIIPGREGSIVCLRTPYIILTYLV